MSKASFPQWIAGFYSGWTTRIRTGNDRTKTCSVTITPSSNYVLEYASFCKFGCKDTKKMICHQIFSYLSYPSVTFSTSIGSLRNIWACSRKVSGFSVVR